jgi:triosephosphate isomerase
MRKPIIAGNWKMNKTLSEATAFISSIIPLIETDAHCDIIVAPSFICLDRLNQLINKTNVSLAAQTISAETEGAFTGEISISMIKSCGCDYVLLGHSEQRLYHNETNANCHRKCSLAFENKITPIYCIGETLNERESNQTLAVIETQLNEGLLSLPLNEHDIIIAYEPVWAIGTGKVATPEQAQEVHAFIRETLSKHLGNAIAQKTRIIYGGSVNPGNIESLLKQPDIDGSLVGGACLKADSFVELIKKTSAITQ